MPSIGTSELIIIAGVVLLFFGGKKTTEFFKGLREAIKEFRRSAKDTGQDEAEDKT